jgi:hypothetical protein
MDLSAKEKRSTVEEREETKLQVRNSESAGLDHSVLYGSLRKRALKELGVTSLEVAVAIYLLRLLKTRHLAVIPEPELEKIRTRYELLTLDSDR